MVLTMLLRAVTKRSARLGSALGGALWAAKTVQVYQRFAGSGPKGEGGKLDSKPTGSLAVQTPATTKYEWWADD